MERKPNFSINKAPLGLPPIRNINKNNYRVSQSVKPLKHNSFMGTIQRQSIGMSKVPKVTAKCWGIYDINKMGFVHGKREYFRREVASLTKIMTFYVVYQVSKEFKLKIPSTEVKVSNVASDIRGTTAFLKTGDILTVEQLLYGLMLPSGNDAAFALSQHYGKILYKKKYKSMRHTIWSFQFDYHPYYTKYFLQEMNEMAQKIGMTQTHFDSPHGLQNIENLSTAHDICKLTAVCMKFEIFRKVVQTKVYECTAKQYIPSKFSPSPEEECKAIQENESDQNNKKVVPFDTYYSLSSDSEYQNALQNNTPAELFKVRHFKWENTNLLLGRPGYTGCKTGITEASGPCCSVTYQKDGHNFVIVLLNSISMPERWKEVPLLVEWAIQRREPPQIILTTSKDNLLCTGLQYQKFHLNRNMRH